MKKIFLELRYNTNDFDFYQNDGTIRLILRKDGGGC